MKGIDISAWQENIDWDAVVASGVEFVILKLGQSGRLDPMFVEHANNAVDKGLKIGVYVYSTAKSDAEAKEEAEWVDLQIITYLNGKCPEMGIWYDMEEPHIEQSGCDITQLCSTFINHLNSVGYQNVGIYSSYNWLTNGNIDTSILDVPYWCAQYNYECNFEHPKLVIWQNTDKFEIAGQFYDGNILMNKE